MRFPSSRIPKSEKISVLSDSEKAWGKAEIKVDGYFSSPHRKRLSEKQLYCNIMMYNSSTSEMSVVSPTSTSASESSPSSLAPLKKRTEKKWGSPRQIYRKEFSTDSSDGVEKHARHRKEEEDLAIAAARVSEGSDSIPSIESAQPRLRTVDEYLSKRRTRVIIVSGSPPFHVQYANKAWSNACGWSSEEVLGLDCKFLQGEATSMRTLRKFLANIAQSEEPRELSIMNYKKDDTLLANRLICYPIKNSLFSKKKPREEGPSSPSNFYRVPLSHFVCVLEESDEAEFTNEQMISRLGHQLEEVGLPIDRREQSKAYPYLGRYPAPKLSEWAIITKKLTVSLALQYMLETQAPAMLVDSRCAVVHMNPGWATSLNCRMVDCEEKPFNIFIHSSTESGQLDILEHLLSHGNARDRKEYAKVVLQSPQGAAHSAMATHASPLLSCDLSVAILNDDIRLIMALWWKLEDGSSNLM